MFVLIPQSERIAIGPSRKTSSVSSSMRNTSVEKFSAISAVSAAKRAPLSRRYHGLAGVGFRWKYLAATRFFSMSDSHDLASGPHRNRTTGSVGGSFRDAIESIGVELRGHI